MIMWELMKEVMDEYTKNRVLLDDLTESAISANIKTFAELCVIYSHEDDKEDDFEGYANYLAKRLNEEFNGYDNWFGRNYNKQGFMVAEIRCGNKNGYNTSCVISPTSKRAKRKAIIEVAINMALQNASKIMTSWKQERLEKGQVVAR